MNYDVLEALKEIQSGTLSAGELEEKEFLLLQELCGSQNYNGIATVLRTLAQSGTILAIPVLFGLSRGTDEETSLSATMTINLIKARAKARGSLLPDIYFTLNHWRPKWLAGKKAFLSYVQFIATAYINCGNPESELNRIGKILAKEMNIDIRPHENFADYMICQSDWDFGVDLEIIQGRMEEERALEDMEALGVGESDVSFISRSLMELQYDYLIARLKLKGDLNYYRFVLEMAECLNKEEG